MRVSKGRAERESTRYKMIKRKMSRMNPWYVPLMTAAKRAGTNCSENYVPEVGQIVLDLCPKLVRKREREA